MSDGTLIASISGIRGIVGDGLDPSVLVRYAAAYGTWARRRARSDGRDPLIVVGRDARPSGPVCASIVIATLQSMGCDVVDAGLATTPTVEMAVIEEEAAGGIILSASHNPEPWNALKLLNERGEFLTPAEGETVMQMADREEAEPVGVGTL
ncbi:MAG: phosphoglucosamine mutase, partial [Bacteroidetes bacterium]|nr:phosphoglucosamine mutase [Bacteroidota bacterium]